MKIEDILVKDVGLIKTPTLETIEKYAKSELKKNGYFQRLIIMKRGADVYFCDIPYQSREERSIIMAGLKEIIHESKIEQYWVIGEIWMRSNPDVSENLDKNKTEALSIAEYNFNKKAKMIYLHYETKDDTIVFGKRIEIKKWSTDAWDFYNGYEPKPKDHDPAYG